MSKIPESHKDAFGNPRHPQMGAPRMASEALQRGAGIQREDTKVVTTAGREFSTADKVRVVALRQPMIEAGGLLFRLGDLDTDIGEELERRRAMLRPPKLTAEEAGELLGLKGKRPQTAEGARALESKAWTADEERRFQFLSWKEAGPRKPDDNEKTDMEILELVASWQRQARPLVKRIREQAERAKAARIAREKEAKERAQARLDELAAGTEQRLDELRGDDDTDREA